VPGPGDDLTMRTLPAFFGVLELLLAAGVTTEADYIRRHLAFDRVSLAAPQIEVDTTSGYRPGIDQVVAFINGP
jgi:hypothetical protein